MSPSWAFFTGLMIGAGAMALVWWGSRGSS